MSAAKTEPYAVRPEKYLAVMLNIYLRRYRLLMAVAAITAVVLSVFIPDFIYAVIVVAFGAFPFILFHVYFRYAGKYDNKYLFTEKSISVDGTILTLHPVGGASVSYPASSIKYCGYAKKNHMLVIEDKYIISIPLASFTDYDSLSVFQNWLDTQIIKRTCRK